MYTFNQLKLTSCWWCVDIVNVDEVDHGGCVGGVDDVDDGCVDGIVVDDGCVDEVDDGGCVDDVDDDGCVENVVDDNVDDKGLMLEMSAQ